LQVAVAVKLVLVEEEVTELLQGQVVAVHLLNLNLRFRLTQPTPLRLVVEAHHIQKEATLFFLQSLLKVVEEGLMEAILGH
jgi:hypothetical protein